MTVQYVNVYLKVNECNSIIFGRTVPVKCEAMTTPGAEVIEDTLRRTNCNEMSHTIQSTSVVHSIILFKREIQNIKKKSISSVSTFTVNAWQCLSFSTHFSEVKYLLKSKPLLKPC